MNEMQSHNTPSSSGKAAWICLFIAWATFIIPLPFIGMFIGLPLNLAAFILAIVAMAKDTAKAGLAQLLCSIIVSPIIYFIGIAIISAIGVAATGELPAPTAAP